MFSNTRIEILQSPEVSPVKVVYGDVQPYSGNMSFDYGISLEISKRAFCDIDFLIDESCYFKIDTAKYKVLAIKVWSDYLEIFLYKCKR